MIQGHMKVCKSGGKVVIIFEGFAFIPTKILQQTFLEKENKTSTRTELADSMVALGEPGVGG